MARRGLPTGMAKQTPAPCGVGALPTLAIPLQPSVGSVGEAHRRTQPAAAPQPGGNSRGKGHKGYLGRDTTELTLAEGRDGFSSPLGQGTTHRRTHRQTHSPAEARGAQHQFQPRDRPGADADTSCPHSVGLGCSGERFRPFLPPFPIWEKP